MRRDTVTVPGYSHVVLRIRANNPGIWALHCHILWHAEGESACFPKLGTFSIADPRCRRHVCTDWTAFGRAAGSAGSSRCEHTER